MSFREILLVKVPPHVLIVSNHVHQLVERSPSGRGPLGAGLSPTVLGDVGNALNAHPFDGFLLWVVNTLCSPTASSLAGSAFRLDPQSWFTHLRLLQELVTEEGTR